MLLEANKIYPTYKLNNFIQLPTIEVTEGVKIFVSNEGPKPESLEQMIELEGVADNKINALYSNTRWLAVTYENEKSEAYEMGIVGNPFKAEKIYRTAVIDDKGTILLATDKENLEY